MVGNLGGYQTLSTIAKKLHGPGGLVTALVGGGIALGTGASKLSSWGVNKIRKQSTMTLVYPAVFNEMLNNGKCTVTFPDVPDTVVISSTAETAFKQAPEVLASSLAKYKEYPKPSHLKTVQDNFPDLTVMLISVDVKVK
ncbi:hypothetical protein [Lacticaseibacillus paracasei]|uniref:hypothetical protein n=1 Tax=Lacticaseibacillus paracasei TaxID=1597 RepID=UPI0028DD502F|nr:hypothetical protein [Lacticaseibacillus paracasei]MDT8951605.1 hypothetical protein [Lacticaseibacillus paracasei subsp. paracasei]